MALLDEQIVEEWLNRKHFFTMRGIKCGVDEIDLLALRHKENMAELWHVEVQVSYRPIGYIGGDSNARKRTDEEIREGVEQWVDKKFKRDIKVQRRNEIFPNASWRYVLVHGELKNTKELEYMQQEGVELHSYKSILEDLRDTENKSSSSIASNIADMLKYLKNKPDSQPT
jgi:hypothetical protein